jgi:hypothetical protein
VSVATDESGDGVTVGNQGRSGLIDNSTNPLQVGGDSFFGQYFNGVIDEVRVYDVALSAGQIQVDMMTPI